MEPLNRHAGGRPPGSGSTYRPEFCRALIDYFECLAQAPERELAPTTTTIGSDKGVSQKAEVRRICAELPTIEGFAVSVGIPSSTIRAWAAPDGPGGPEFRAAYARARDIQRQVLVDRGLTRQYDPTAFMFVAKNITDMRDVRQLEGTGDGGSPIRIMIGQAGGSDDRE